MSDSISIDSDDPLHDKGEVLFRQVHPDLISQGQPGWSAFRPTPRDEEKLSLDRSNITTAKGSFTLHTHAKAKKSAGTWGLTVGEFETVALLCYSDPIEASEDGPANDAHAVADYNGHEKAAIKKIALALQEKAIARGKIFPDD
jgi:hypothetical protein